MPPDLFGPRTSPLLDAIDASRKALDASNAAFFAERLPPREHHRIAASFPTQTAFLDIETTGLSLYYDTITLIGCAIGETYACHVMGADNDRSSTVVDLIESAKCVVTFNGTTFDLKFLAKHLPYLQLPTAHVDLRHLSRRAALRGGQKEVEKALGLPRPDELEDIDGAQAVLLWYEYVSGDLEAGQRLVRYNHADVEGMKPILDHAVARIVEDEQHAATKSCGFAKRAARLQIDDTAAGVHVPAFVTPSDAAITYDRLTVALQSDLRVVGIDLTGSAARPSGWCQLRGPAADTGMVGSDDEIMELVEQARPHIVSIDSPLSLPSGRLRVEDDDPGRQKYGIMRVCERTLKRRGINVYPCLIPSMQRLTARGIALARTLRRRGIPVIESYPGAAQDIMNIPRKGAGIEHLKKGLALFGITGDYIHSKVTHDELDAITAAVVGVYFWAGRFEGLGNIDEDYLIIPDLARTNRTRRVVGISGPIAAGKTTSARLLESVGFDYGRYSEVLAALAIDDGKQPDRATLQELGNRVHRDPGQRWLNDQLLHRLRADGARDLVIDGLRWPEDHAFWVERFGPTFRHVHVRAPKQMRRERYASTGRSTGEFDVAAFHEVESGVGELAALAHVVADNDRRVHDMRNLLAERIDARLIEDDD